MNPDRKIDFLWRVLDREEQLARAADQKLSFFLVLTTAMLSGIAAIMSGKLTMAARAAHPMLFGGLLTLIFCSGAFALLLELAVLIPRTWRKRKHETPRSSLLFFFDIHRLPDDGYFSAISALDEEQVIRDLSCQIESLSDIVTAKMGYVKWLTIFTGVEITGIASLLALLGLS